MLLHVPRRHRPTDVQSRHHVEVIGQLMRSGKHFGATEQEAGWVPELVYLGEAKSTLHLLGFKPDTVQATARSQPTTPPRLQHTSQMLPQNSDLRDRASVVCVYMCLGLRKWQAGYWTCEKSMSMKIHFVCDVFLTLRQM